MRIQSYKDIETYIVHYKNYSRYHLDGRRRKRLVTLYKSYSVLRKMKIRKYRPNFNATWNLMLSQQCTVIFIKLHSDTSVSESQSISSFKMRIISFVTDPHHLDSAQNGGVWWLSSQLLHCATEDRVVGGSNHTGAARKLWQFPLPH